MCGPVTLPRNLTKARGNHEGACSKEITAQSILEYIVILGMIIFLIAVASGQTRALYTGVTGSMDRMQTRIASDIQKDYKGTIIEQGGKTQ
jgi:hypothetical protein